jgi:Mn-dependent DtxR family transcriptional regulator
MDDSSHLTLTESGREIAIRVYERHNIISGYLQMIGVSAETAVKDACRVEHVLSEESFQILKDLYLKSQKQ